MIVYDIHGNLIENPDLTLGMLIEKERPITHRYEVTQPEVGYWNTINLDPETGGREVEWVVETQEKGVWRTYDAENNVMAYDGEYPTDTSTKTVPDTQTYFIYQVYTDEDLEQMGKKQEMDQLKVAVGIFAQTLTDEEALAIPLVYPAWEDIIGRTVKAGHKFLFEDDLYKTIQPDLTISKTNTPGKGTESLYAKINETNAGTLDDPIPYEANMEIFEGKYYSQDNVIYLCIRDSEQPLYHDLSTLVGMYVEVYTAE